MWEFLKNEGNSRALAIIVPLALAIIGGAWAAYVHFTSQPQEKNPEYSIYLDSEITPFIDGYVDNFSPPYQSRPKPKTKSDIWYVRRDQSFVPHSIDLYFHELADLSAQDIVSEIAEIRKNKLLHETLLPEGFFKIMTSAGNILDGRYRRAVTSKERDYPALSSLFSVQFKDKSSIAAFFMYHTSDVKSKVVNFSPDEIYRETRKIWLQSNKDNSFETEDKLVNSLILGQYNPVFFLTTSNHTDKTIILSDVTVDAERILPSASGLKSGFVDVVDTIIVPLQGLEAESVNQKFSRPINIPPGESATVRLVIDSQLMFIYKIQITLFNGQQQLHKYEPFLVDYFSEI